MDVELLRSKIKTKGEVPSVGRDTINFTTHILNQSGKKILDLGTGSGFIGISLALKGCDVTASDINLNALEIAKENAFNLGVDIKFIHSNLFDNISDKFDLICFNPPMGNTSGKRNLEFIKRFFPKTKFTVSIGSSIFSSSRKKLLKKFVLVGRYHLNKDGFLMLFILQKEREFIETLVGKEKVEIVKSYKNHNSEIIKIYR